MLAPELFDNIEKTVNMLVEFKHGKVDPEKIETLRAVEILANVSGEVFRNSVFGYFEQVRKQKFGSSYGGIFRYAHGNPPFTQTLIYEGDVDFSSEQTFVVNLDTMQALSLLPLIFWDNCDNHKELDNGHCYLYDIEQAPEESSFKAVGYTCVCKVTSRNKYSGLANTLKQFRFEDLKAEAVKIGKLTA